MVDFEQFREPLERALGYADGSKGGRPPYDPVVMFKSLILAARHTVSDEHMPPGADYVPGRRAWPQSSS